MYRRKHLLIGTSRADAATYPLGQKIAEVLATYLPESSARVTRGPDPWRLASLLTTGQLEVALLSHADVAALRDGVAPFEAFGPTALNALFAFGNYLLVCRPDFPPHHAYQVVQTLSENTAGIAGAMSVDATVESGGDPRRRARLCAGRADARADRAGGRDADSRSRALTPSPPQARAAGQSCAPKRPCRAPDIRRRNAPAPTLIRL